MPLEKADAPDAYRSRRIMIVDDSAYERRLIARALMRRLPGVDFTVAPDGVFATEMLESDRPDLVVLDIKMPLLDGLELLRRWRAMDISAPPVIVITNSVDPEEHTAALRAGAVSVIQKPYDEADYVAAIGSIQAILGELEG